jgi:hypothetical protein
MKKYIILLAWMLSATYVFAQPSKSAMLEKIKTDHHKGLISVEMEGEPRTEHLWEDGVWKDYYRHSYEALFETKYSGVSSSYYGSIQYIKAGSDYVFDTYLVGSSNLVGVQEPDRASIIKLLKSDLRTFLEGYHYHKVVGDISEITFPADPEWYWRNFTIVEFLVNVSYTEKAPESKLIRAEHTYKVSLVSEEFQGPWISFHSSDIKEKIRVISTKQLSSAEMNKLKTLMETNAESAAANSINSLPKVEIPKFASDQQLFYFVHEKIMNEPTDKMKAYLYELMDKSCFESGSSVQLSGWTSRWFDNLVKKHAAYKQAHCLYPSLESKQSGSIGFYDRENRRILSMKANKTADSWTLSRMDFYAAPESELNRMKNNNANCQEKPDLSVREVKSYQVGGKVVAKFSNGNFPCKVDKIDPYNSNRYYVRLLSDPKGRGYWMDEVSLKPYTGSATKETSTQATETKTEISFSIGDAIRVNTSRGWLKGKILQKLGTKYEIKLDNPGFRNMWVSKDHLKKN